jgi:cytoskeletal protein CcmA (bactofilin family)
MFKEKIEGSLGNQIETEKTTILKEDTSFEGKLSFEGAVIINGKFSGEILSSGDLIIGKTGNVEGKIEIGSVVIHGEVSGDIKARQKIVINAPASVQGDIVAPSLMIEEGAVFEGNCSMGKMAASTKTRDVTASAYDEPASTIEHNLN